MCQDQALKLHQAAGVHLQLDRKKEQIISYALIQQWYKRGVYCERVQPGTPAGLAMTA